MSPGEEKSRIYKLLEISYPSTLLVRDELITSLFQIPGVEKEGE